MKKFANTLTKIFHWLFLFMVGFLFVGSLLVTGRHLRNGDKIVEDAITVWSNPLITILKLILAIGFVLLLEYVSRRIVSNSKFRIKWYLIGTMAISFFISVFWLNCAHIAPVADQRICCSIAEATNNGSFSSIHGEDYLTWYPHLLGLCGFLRLLNRIFGEGFITAFKYFNALCVPLMVFSGYKIVRKLSKNNDKVSITYLFYMLLCVPMYGYVHYIYGDFCGTAFGVLALWLFMETVEKPCIKNWIFTLLSLLVAIVLRKNCLIILAAMAVVMVVKLIKAFSVRNLVTCGVLLLTLILSENVVSWIYLPEKPEVDHGIPAIANMVMALNDDNGYAGCYNNYEVYVYVNNGKDLDVVKNAAKNDFLTKYLPKYKEDPTYCAGFFFRKLMAQWEVPLYQCFVMNMEFDGPQNILTRFVYDEIGERILEFLMKLYQMALYGSLLYIFIKKRKESFEIENYVLLIAVFGGFLLSVVWEAKARYVFPYLFMMIPYFAIGSNDFSEGINRLINEKIRKKDKKVEN